MIVTKSYRIYEIVFFTGIIGASQAILTPNVQYAFPHFRFIEFFIAHILLIWAPLFMTWVEGYSPTLQSIKRTMVFLNIVDSNRFICELQNRWQLYVFSS